MQRPNTILMYGKTGTRKTSQIAEIAQWHYDRTGEITLLISGDSGWAPCDEKIANGIIIPWSVEGIEQNPRPLLIQASLGYWPEVTLNGDGTPRIAMKKLSRSPEGRILSPKGDGKTVGIYAIEGLASLSNLLMQDHIRNQRKLGQDVVGVWTENYIVVDDQGRETAKTMQGAKAAMSHYQAVQDTVLLELVPKFSHLPVGYVVWTSHEGVGEDERIDSRAFLGPGTIGKSAVPKTGQKFGDTFHLQVESAWKQDPATKAKKLEQVYKAWYVEHPDDVLTHAAWPAKISLPVELAKTGVMEKKFPGGFISLGKFSIADFLELKWQATAQQNNPVTHNP